MTHFADHYRKILEFVKSQTLTVLSTVSAEGKPESAAVEGVVTDNFVIIFDTFKSFRKYANLQGNPHVSLVFGWQNDITVQIEGIAEEIDGELKDYYQWYYLQKLPSASKFATMSEIVWFRVVPNWARYTDVAKEPWESFEIRPKVTELELRNLSRDALVTLTKDPQSYCRDCMLNANGVDKTLQSIAQQTLRLAGDDSEMRWFGYLANDRKTRDVVGTCGFKGPPSDHGAVEIAYFTFPPFEGRGYATEMARQLLSIALRTDEIHTICAHTLPSINASSKILQKVGMHYVGEAEDPDEGKVWRWELHRKI